jgi:alginate O-acetyltransferase complex protein AlgI
MTFNSFTFLIFFLIVLVLHYSPFPWRVKKFNLLIASYLFYAAWNPPFIVLLWISTVVDWFAAKMIYAARTPLKRRIGLAATVIANIGFLGFFKYGNFLLDSFITAARAVGIDYQPVRMDIILPVGISFYTFQTLSYTLDVYRGRDKPWGSFLDFALYVTFFPQLVAGPIVRAEDFLGQCEKPRQANASQFAWGLNLFLIGLFQKVVIADGLLAPVVEKVYTASAVDSYSSWVGTLAFAGQIFCDFAGYSTAAIGTAMCLGFALPDNFRFPYAAIGFSDFWQRWHISLSTWLRDYLYIPLGGNRGGTSRTYVNLMLTMLIGGLWHGASWTFVMWGGLHGCFLIAERLLRESSLAAWRLWRTQAGQAFLGAVTFLLVCIAWTYFRATSFAQAFAMVQSMIWLDLAQSDRVALLWDGLIVGMTMTGLLGCHWYFRNRGLEEAMSSSRVPIPALVNAAMMIAIVTMPGEDRAFIYFQF